MIIAGRLAYLNHLPLQTHFSVVEFHFLYWKGGGGGGQMLIQTHPCKSRNIHKKKNNRKA